MSKQKKCALDGCNKNARRKFCSNKHKDRYHNLTNPRGQYAHLADRDDYFGFPSHISEDPYYTGSGG